MKRYLVTIELCGPIDVVENNLDLILDTVDPLFLDSCNITVKNNSDEVE